MSLMDVPLIRRTDTRATRGGQRSRQTLVLQDGFAGSWHCAWHACWALAR